MRKFLCASLFLVVAVGMAAAEEFRGVISKVEGGKITFHTMKFKKGEQPEKGEAKTFAVAENVKVVTGKFNREEKKFESGEALQGGLQNERFKTIGERGVFARIVTEGDKVTEVHVLDRGGRGKKKQNDQ